MWIAFPSTVSNYKSTCRFLASFLKILPNFLKNPKIIALKLSSALMRQGEHIISTFSFFNMLTVIYELTCGLHFLPRCQTTNPLVVFWLVLWKFCQTFWKNLKSIALKLSSAYMRQVERIISTFSFFNTLTANYEITCRLRSLPRCQTTNPFVVFLG